MSALIDKRKRSREDDVLCESTPLSKRINNLHLSNFDEMTQFHQQYQYNNDHHHQQQQQQQQQQHQHYHNTEFQHHTNYQQTNPLINSSVNSNSNFITYSNGTNSPHHQHMGNNNYWPQLYEPDNILLQQQPNENIIDKSTVIRNNLPFDADSKCVYNPELDPTENPFYYFKNKLLHELHIERMKRLPF